MSESAHAERFFNRNGKLFKVCRWKRIHHYRKYCEHPKCKEVPTYVVGWKIPRFYGFKIAQEALCTIHANEWYEQLLKSHDIKDIHMLMIPEQIPQYPQ